MNKDPFSRHIEHGLQQAREQERYRSMAPGDAADMAGGVYDPSGIDGRGPEAGMAIERRVLPEEVKAYQVASDALMRRIGGHLASPALPVPRPGVNLADHMAALRKMGYRV